MATRIIVEVENGEVRPVAVRHVEMLVPEQPGGAASAELYAELRDGDENPLLGVSVSAHLRPLEVFAPDGSINVLEGTTHKQTVMLLVPDVEGARSVVFMRRRAPVGGRRNQRTPQSDSGAPEELARVSLDAGEKR